MRDESDVAIGETLAPSSSEATQLDSSRPPRDRASPVTLVPADPARYAITGEVGRGGLGRIMRARDQHLGRHVAIKELLHDDGELASRFAREALVTARLMHPAIVPVYDAGTWPSGLPFYAMKLVSGRSLDAVIRDAKTPRDRLALLPNAIAVTEAIAYAHGEGIIHRDLKPANVLVGSFGETVVIDWGLAKDLRAPDEPTSPISGDRRGSETIAGAVMGTPSYMPPEQARGEAVDERADVYAIGALLYHILSGVPPYAGPTADRVLAQVVEAPPKALPVEGVPAELATIVGKAMARDPAARYRTAAELAADLRRFQTGGLVTAHAYTTRALIRRWIARHRGVVAVAAIALAVLAAGGAYAIRRIYVARDAAVAGEAKARQRADEAVLAQASAVVDQDPSAAIRALAGLSLDSPAWNLARVTAADARERGIASRELVLGDGAAVAGFVADRVLIAYDRASVYRWRTDTGEVTRLAAMPAGASRIFVAGARVLAKTPLGVVPIEPDGPMLPMARLQLAAATADGKRLAMVGDAFAVVELATGARQDLPIATASSRGGQLALSPDGALAAFTTPWELTICALAPVQCHGVPALAPEAPQSLDVMIIAFAPDSAHLAWGGPGKINALEIASGTSAPITAIEGAPRALAYAPDGVHLAIGTADHLAVWDGAALASWATASIDQLEVGPERVATATGDGTIVAPLSGGIIHRLHGQGDAIGSIAMRGDAIASASADGTIRLWEMRAMAAPCGLRSLVGLAIGERIAAFPRDGAIGVCDLATGAVRTVTASPPVGEWLDAAIAPGGRQLAIATPHALIAVDLDTGATRALSGRVEHVAWTRAGLFAATSTELKAWTDVAGPPRSALRFDVLHGFVVAPDGAHAIAGRYLVEPAPRDPPVLVDLATGAQLPLPGEASFAFSPRGDRLASTSAAGIAIRTLATAEVATLPDPRARILVWSPDGAALASIGDDRTVRVWDVASRTVRIAMRGGPSHGVADLAFSPDGTRLAILASNGEASLVDVATVARRALGKVDGIATSIRFWPDGATILVGRDRAPPIVWRDDLPTDPAQLHDWLVESSMIRDRVAR